MCEHIYIVFTLYTVESQRSVSREQTKAVVTKQKKSKKAKLDVKRSTKRRINARKRTV